MKYLLILRHAKSDWDNPALDDHDRPLNARGMEEAPRVGRFLLENNLIPDFVISSTALRARQTTNQVLDTCQYDGDVFFTRSCYMANPAAYKQALRSVPGNPERVLLVGHNPGLEDLASQLTSENLTLKTAALVFIALPIQEWNELAQDTRGTLEGQWAGKNLPHGKGKGK